MEAEKPFVVTPSLEFPEEGDIVVYYNDSQCKLIRTSPRSSTRGGHVTVQKNKGDLEQNESLSSTPFSAFPAEKKCRKTIPRNSCCPVVLAVLTIVSLCIAIASLTLTVLLLLQVIPIQDQSRASPTVAPPTNATATESTSSGTTAPPYVPPPCTCSCNCTAELQQVFQVQERLNISVGQIEDLLLMFEMLNTSLSTLATDFHAVNSTVTSLQSSAASGNNIVEDLLLRFEMLNTSLSALATDFRAVNSTVTSLQSNAASGNNMVNRSSLLSNLSIPANLHGVEAYSNCSTVKATSCTIPGSFYAGIIPSFKYCKTDEVPTLPPDLYSLDVTCAVEESTSLAPIVATLQVSENTGNMRCLCYVVVTSTSALGPSNLDCHMFIKRCPSSETLQVTINTN